MQRTAGTLLRLGVASILLLSFGCAGTPASSEAEATTPAPPEGEPTQEQQIATLQEEVRRLRAELRTAEERLEEVQTQSEAAESGGPEKETLTQLQRENERLRGLVEELRLALIAAEGVDADHGEQPPVEPESAAPVAPPFSSPQAPAADPSPGPLPSAPTPESSSDFAEAGVRSFERVTDVNPALPTDTPSHLNAQGIERVPREGEGYRYVEATANNSTGEGIFLELILLPDMELPEAVLRAKSVYPAEEPPLLVGSVAFSVAGQLFELEPEEVERVRSGSLAAESASFLLHPDVRRLLTLTQRRPEADLTVTFVGETGRRVHHVTRRERLALANMIYTLREMGVEL